MIVAGGVPKHQKWLPNDTPSTYSPDSSAGKVVEMRHLKKESPTWASKKRLHPDSQGSSSSVEDYHHGKIDDFNHASGGVYPTGDYLYRGIIGSGNAMMGIMGPNGIVGYRSQLPPVKKHYNMPYNNSDPTSEHGAPTQVASSGSHQNGLYSSSKPDLNHGSADSTSANQEVLPMYANAAAAPSRLPAHRPVRLNQPKHNLAPQGTPVYFKYGEEHYPEETIPDPFTFTENDGTVCRYITNFLVYNKRGERLLPIEVLDQPRHGALVLYGSLLPASTVGSPNDMENPGKRTNNSRNANNHSRYDTRRRNGSLKSKRRQYQNPDDDGPSHVPYPVRIELSEWCIDYGQEPQNVPFIWLISRWDVYYRLEKPAGRYIPTFATAKMKFEVSTRIIKTLQFRPDFPYRELVDLLTAATRQERMKRRIADQRQRRKDRRSFLKRKQEAAAIAESDRFSPNGSKENDLDDISDNSGCDDENSSSVMNSRQLSGSAVVRKKYSRPNWRVHHSLSTPQGTGVTIDGPVQPKTPWGASFAVDGVRESTLLGLIDFLDSQVRNFLDGVGGSGGNCANLLETRFMQTLREKASIRRETLQLVEAKKRAIESMAVASGFPHMMAASHHHMPPHIQSPAPPQHHLGSHCDLVPTPIVALQVMQPMPLRQGIPPGTQIGNGALLMAPIVAVGFTGPMQKSAFEGTKSIHLRPYSAGQAPHQAMMLFKTRHQEEMELSQLLQLLKEFSDPEGQDNLEGIIKNHRGDELDDEAAEDFQDSDLSCSELSGDELVMKNDPSSSLLSKKKSSSTGEENSCPPQSPAACTRGKRSRRRQKAVLDS